MIELTEEEKAERPTTILLRKNIMDVLNRHYPHMSVWPIDVSASTKRATPWLIDIKDFKTGGTVTIRNLLLSGKMGVQLPLSMLDAEGKVIIRYVGELFERYGIARSKGLDMREEILGLPRDFKGQAIGDNT